MLTKEQINLIDKAIDKILDSSTVGEGLKELETLGVIDEAVIFWRAEALVKLADQENDQIESKKMISRAIRLYEYLISRGSYDFLKETVEQLKQRVRGTRVRGTGTLIH